MPLYRQLDRIPESERERKQRREKEDKRGEEEYPASLRQLCLMSLAENMNEVWVKDYSENYMNQYFFRYVMGPFSLLPGELLEELLMLLSRRRLLTRPALHLLLQPQLHSLSLSSCPNLVSANVCALISVRCQSLQALDLSGAVGVSAVVLGELLASLPSLSSVSLGGTQCDGRVLDQLSLHCPRLRRLDVSRCAHLSPANLLSLVSPGQRSKVIHSVQALDIGFGDSEMDSRASIAYLLLALPELRRLAIEGLGRACQLIQRQEFSETEDFLTRRGLASLREVWNERRRGYGHNESESERENEGGGWLMNVEEHFRPEEREMDGMMRGEEEPRNSKIREGMDEGGRRTGEEIGERDESERVTLCVEDVQGVSIRTLGAVGRLCPNLCSLSLDCCNDDDDGDDEDGVAESVLLARGLAQWAGRLQSLRVRFPRPVEDVLPAAQSVGSNLLSLTLEGLRVPGCRPLVELIQYCPRLTSLAAHLEPPQSGREEEEEEEDEDDEAELWNLPSLPQLQSLMLNFSLDERQVRPVMGLRSLKGVLWAVLRGSPLLEDVSLLAVPCPLDPVFRLVLDHRATPLGCSDHPPLTRLRRARLNRSDVSMETAWRLVTADNRLQVLDLRGCWPMCRNDITKLQNKARRRRYTLNISWS